MPVVSASAAPSKADKLAEARAVKAQITVLDHKVEVASEDYNLAKSKHAALASQRDKAAARAAKAEKRIDTLQKHLGTRATGMYRTGQLGFLDVLLGAKSFEQFARTWDLLKQLNESDVEAVIEMKKARAVAVAARKEYTTKAAAADKQVGIMSSKRQSILAQLSKRKSTLSGIESQVAALEAQEEARARATAVRWTKRATSNSDWSGPAPSKGPNTSVVAFARRYLGAPYVWAADGPNSFDCSGFTMFVYRHFGVNLPHSSRAQIGYGERVSRNNLAPGDLVFFGSPIHHVGIYVGGGMYIHAPRTGDVVKISSMSRGDFAGACRP